MYHDSNEFFHSNVLEYMSQTIERHHGDEVFFVAWVDRNGKVSECEAIAFGNNEAVPAPLAEGLKGDLVIHNHPSGDLRASNPDINIASLLATRKLGFYIINNDCSEINVIYKPKSRIFLDEKEVLSVFKKNGALSELLGYYEERPEQEKLVQEIVKAINDDKLFLAEAGTGTGKSLSYLVPTALWAVLSDKRVFVTTHTINLQNQIAQKDAELVASTIERITGQRPRFAMLVGRSNYLCPKNLQEFYTDSEKTTSLFENPDSIAHQLDIVSKWANSTEQGLRSEIPEKINNDLWEEISASTPNCPRKECPFYTDCFYFKARMVAESSHILIGNHALLLAAIDEESGFMPTIPHFSGLVLDEAHSLSDITLQAMAEGFSFGSIQWRISRLYRQNRDRFFGQLSLLKDRSAIDRYPELSGLFYRLSSNVLDLHHQLKDTESRFRLIMQDHVELSNEINTTTLKLGYWQEARPLIDSLFQNIKTIEMQMTQLIEKSQEEFPEPHILDILKVIDIHNTALYNMRQAYEKIFNNLDADTMAVKQMEYSNYAISFSAGPATVEDFLAKHIFRVKDFVIFASATLSVTNNFTFFKEGIGLHYTEEERQSSIILPSPFNYKEQMTVLVVNENYLNPKQKDLDKINLVRHAVQIAGGGTLLLFTSYKVMDYYYRLLAPEFTELGLHPLKQGDYSREHLINTMRAKDYTVLFGTSSFWEGVDIQGDHLRCVIIDKLPFDNPYNPYIKAISKIYEDKGKNPFTEFSVPRAVLKYKQGIGRLIRSKKDKGILVVLDGRIFSKFYGKSFVQTALPAQSHHLSPNEILRHMELFFQVRRP